MKKKNFLYCMNEDGGMSTFEFSRDTALSEFETLYGWLHPSCINDDKGLVYWTEYAEVGDTYEHRLGICIRLKDKVIKDDTE